MTGASFPDAPADTQPRRRAGVIAGAAVLAVVVVAASAFVLTRGGDAEARPLALAFVRGDTESYEISQTMDATIGSALIGEQRLTMAMTQTVTWRVLEVDSDGVATIEVSSTDVSGTVNGAELPATSSEIPPIQIVIASDGRVLSAGGLALGGAGHTDGFGFPGMGQLTPILPDDGEAVAPGDAWDKDFSQDFPFGEGTIAFAAQSEYLRDEIVDDVDAAVIRTEMAVPVDFTLSFADLLDEFGDEAFGAGDPAELDALRAAQIASDGEGSVVQTSWVDLSEMELLRTRSEGAFDLSMELAGIPDLPGGVMVVDFAGTFTQSMERA